MSVLLDKLQNNDNQIRTLCATLVTGKTKSDLKKYDEDEDEEIKEID